MRKRPAVLANSHATVEAHREEADLLRFARKVFFR